MKSSVGKPVNMEFHGNFNVLSLKILYLVTYSILQGCQIPSWNIYIPDYQFSV